MVEINLTDELHQKLIQILQEHYESTNDAEELQTINELYKQLHFKSSTWLSSI